MPVSAISTMRCPTPRGMDCACAVHAHAMNALKAICRMRCRLMLSARGLRQGLYRSHVEAILAAFAILIIARQRIAHRREGDLVPRNLALCKEPDLQRFGSGAKLEIEQPRSKQDIHLVDVRDVIERVERAQLNARIGFF